MESFYEINVSHNGRHYFATAQRSFDYEENAHAAVRDFRERFPESEGFQVSCTYWQGRGHEINVPHHANTDNN